MIVGETIDASAVGEPADGSDASLVATVAIADAPHARVGCSNGHRLGEAMGVEFAHAFRAVAAFDASTEHRVAMGCECWTI